MTHPRQLTDPAAVREFTFAGNARLTLVSRKTGTRFTYRVRKADGKGPASHFVSILSGPDNEGDYAYLGLFRLFRDGPFDGIGPYEHGGRKSKIGSDAPCAVAFKWFAAKVLGTVAGNLPSDLEVWHEGRCGMCGRALTVPESIARGIGPECAGRL